MNANKLKREDWSDEITQKVCSWVQSVESVVIM